jgi:hypothetical protein
MALSFCSVLFSLLRGKLNFILLFFDRLNHNARDFSAIYLLAFHVEALA